MSDSLWPYGCSLLDSSVHGIFQARMLGWVAMPSSRESFQPRDWTHISYVSYIDRWVFCFFSSPQAPPGNLGDAEGQGGLVCCSPWGCKELAMTWWLNNNNEGMCFPGGSAIKNIPAMQETQEMQIGALGQEDPLKKEMATHSSIFA